MAEFLSLHWGEQVVGAEASVSSSGAIHVGPMLTASRVPSADNASDFDPEPGGNEDWLASALSAAGVSARQAFVVLGQKDVVTRWLEVPAVPDEELPELVRFQAGTKSTVAVDQLIVDYLPLPMAEDAETRSVLLATVANTTVSEIRRELSKAGLDLRGVGIGSLALTDLALSLADGHATNDGLVIAADKTQVEVTVHHQGHTILTHSAMLSGESDPVRVAGQAISRALFAAGNAVSDLDPTSAILLGSLGPELKEVVQGRLAGSGDGPRIDVVSLADTRLVHFKSITDTELVGSAAMAAAVGGLLTANGQVVERIDFLDPHKPPPPKRRVSNQLAASVILGVLVLVGLVYGGQWWSSQGIKTEIDEIKERVAEKRKTFLDGSRKPASVPSTSEVLAVEKWKKQRVQWLDQLHELSPLLGDSDDVILTEVNMSQDVRKGLGRVTLTGLANDRAPVTRMTSQIRDHKNYNVRPSKLDPNKDRQAVYKFRFSKVNVLLENQAPLPTASKGDRSAASEGRDQEKAEQADTGKAGS
ncbi:MAG: hypothetical protein VYA32_00590 [Planctomycetota bacterium]|nr:hypothetical protein [Planctomycetota bacterium]